MTECAACGSAELRDSWQWDGVHLWQCKDCTARFSEARKVIASVLRTSTPGRVSSNRISTWSGWLSQRAGQRQTLD